MIHPGSYLPKSERPELVFWMVLHGALCITSIYASIAGPQWLAALCFFGSVAHMFALGKWTRQRELGSRTAKEWAKSIGGALSGILFIRVTEAFFPRALDWILPPLLAAWLLMGWAVGLQLWRTSELGPVADGNPTMRV
jgi:hypothetical protein